MAGSFVGFDLRTTDEASAAAFYASVLGWTAAPGALHGPAGAVARVGSTPVGVPTHWRPHVGVDDVDAAVARALAAGATREAGPALVDPAGVPFVVAPDGPAATAIAWTELITADPAAAFGFYRAVVGWRSIGATEPRYVSFGPADAAIGGMMPPPPPVPVPGWMLYWRVADLDAAIALATARGGERLNGPIEVPGGGRVAQLVDPQGGLFALYAGRRA